MRIGLTGGTGYIGGAVGEALAKAGHEVLALSHHAEAEETFLARQWTPLTGDLRDLESLRELARRSDAVIHAAKVDGEDAAEVDTQATHAMLRALEDSRKPFIYTSGVWVLGPGEADEGTDPTRPLSLAAWRVTLEREVLEYGGRDVRSVVLRPGVVWGRGGGIPGMYGRGEIPVVGDGSQTWPVVQLEDLGDLYVRALTVPTGTVLHGIHETVPVSQVAEGAVRESGLKEPLRRLSLEEAREELGAFADALALDQRISARSTRERTKWEPTRSYPVG